MNGQAVSSLVNPGFGQLYKAEKCSPKMAAETRAVRHDAVLTIESPQPEALHPFPFLALSSFLLFFFSFGRLFWRRAAPDRWQVTGPHSGRVSEPTTRANS